MLTATLLAKKRDGHELTDEEIRFLVDGFVRDEVADYQMSAFAMAVCLRGMSPRETATLTQAMLESGQRLPRDVSNDTPRVDKHSTGGLGDKVSLILAPLLAASGVHVPMISGRGLGTTGGTLDKLESIPGFRCDLTESESSRILAEVGCFIVSANESIAPADRRLYALRDVTATIESVPLITASILSKKLAASLDALVMDVKVGSGAFMRKIEDARELARSLETVGTEAGLPTSVLITDMDQPLGSAVGNANEVNEAIAVLKGMTEPESSGALPGLDLSALDALRQLTIELCVPLLVRVGIAQDAPAARTALSRALDSGSAMERFDAMVAAQGGRLKSELEIAPGYPLSSPRSGYVKRIDCGRIGRAIVAMGGGRRKMGDQIDPAVGIDVHARIGQLVGQGQPLLTLRAHKGSQSDYLERLEGAIEVSEEFVPARPLILNRD